MRIFILFAALLFSLNAAAQKSGIITQTITVNGNCEECKKRIENAADIKGVKICNWNPDTKVATITYNSDAISLEKIEQAIARAGYDAGNIKGDDKAYSKLPNCCKYRNGKCEEKGK